jgi:aspartate aminotransferase-like enzyme
LIDGGYGKIKGTTFRISNMGDETEATMNQLYAALERSDETVVSRVQGETARRSSFFSSTAIMPCSL